VRKSLKIKKKIFEHHVLMIKIIEFGVNKFILETRSTKVGLHNGKKVDLDKILNFSLIWKMMCVFFMQHDFFYYY
jgi:hypothetical protein